jgi:regulator of protease activity HflC (stomatin/prohibitin superfamily)
MATHFEPDNSDTPPGAEASYQEEQASAEMEAPRRAASARFIVDSEVGSDAAIRDAMDPANQSLADALRMSFRVLQAVILVLVVLFLASGLRTVDEGKTGVRTRWGRIDADTDAGALSPGLHFSIYPYPIGDFILFNAERSVNVGETFAPMSGGRTREQMLERADSPIMPGRDGSLLTRDGDLAHAEVSAQYVIDQPVEFVESVHDADQKRNADRLVQLALQRATVQVVAAAGLQEVLDQSEELQHRIQTSAQQVLDDLECGIQLSNVRLEGSAPFTIVRALSDVTTARAAAGEQEEKAFQRASKELQTVAGDKADDLIRLIEQYEAALDRNDPAQEEILAQVHAIFESPEVTGAVADIIQEARGYQSKIENALSLEYQQFASLLPAFRKDPKVFAKQHWLATFAKVLSRPDTEIIYVDPLMNVRLTLTGSSEIQEARKQLRLRQKQAEVNAMQGRSSESLWGADRSIETEGRSFKEKRDEKGNLVPIGTDR